MPGAALAQGPVINPRADLFFKLLLVQYLGVGIAERVPLLFPAMQIGHLMRLWDAVQIAPGKVAIDPVVADPINNPANSAIHA